MTVFGLFFVALLLLMSHEGDNIRAFLLSFTTMGDYYNLLLVITILVGCLEVYLIVKSYLAIKWEDLFRSGRYIPWTFVNTLMLGFAIYVLITWNV